MSVRILQGDCREVLRTLPDASVHCCVTSPPYWGLRSYLPKEHADKHLEVGSELSHHQFVAKMVEVFREVWRVLRPEGCVFLNLGDGYANDGKWGGATGGKHAEYLHGGESRIGREKRVTGLKPKDLIGTPWRVALALQDDGWWIRRDIIWHKETCMPEPVEDRCTTSHEYVFHLTKAESYFYDWFAIAEPVESGASDRASVHTNMGRKRSVGGGSVRNKRSVWTINPQPFKGSHFATMPPLLAETCILAGTSEVGCCPHCSAPWERIVEKGEPDEAWRKASGADSSGSYAGQSTKGHAAAGVQDASAVKARILDGMREKITAAWRMTCECPIAKPVPCTVLDPFAGAFTTAMVADRLGRDCIGVDLNPEYCEMARRRIENDAGLFAEIAAE